jgi:hypothetical protein
MYAYDNIVYNAHAVFYISVDLFRYQMRPSAAFRSGKGTEVIPVKDAHSRTELLALGFGVGASAVLGYKMVLYCTGIIVY